MTLKDKSWLPNPALNLLECHRFQVHFQVSQPCLALHNWCKLCVCVWGGSNSNPVPTGGQTGRVGKRFTTPACLTHIILAGEHNPTRSQCSGSTEWSRSRSYSEGIFPPHGFSLEPRRRRTLSHFCTGALSKPLHELNIMQAQFKGTKLNDFI